jgi:Lon-like protease
MRQTRDMTRRGWTLVVGAAVVVLLSAALPMMPVPYVGVAPGSAINTLGTLQGKEVINIEGKKVEKSTGRLSFTTVSVYDRVDLVDAISMWFDDDIAVVPRELIYPPDESDEQLEKESKQEFTSSQQAAEIAALRELKYPIKHPDYKISFDVDDIGGPSAGLMFALGIVEKLDPRDITGGLNIAGTGTIDEKGSVGAIGGIPQKMIAAQRAGAKVFLAPKENCAQAKQTKPKGLRLVKVANLHGALRALELLRTHKNPPSC